MSSNESLILPTIDAELNPTAIDSCSAEANAVWDLSRDVVLGPRLEVVKGEVKEEQPNSHWMRVRQRDRQAVGLSELKNFKDL